MTSDLRHMYKNTNEAVGKNANSLVDAYKLLYSVFLKR
jgi:hypothetical protein